MDLKNPTRTEALLANIAGHTDVPVPDMKNATRSERLLKEILDNGGGGGGDVTKEYVDTAIADAVADIDDDISALSDTVADKVDKENGKSLSTNDYTDADKALVQDSPITTTATGSDLTLSTSSGNLNALTVYGKSEVVDGAIKSAGEGYAVVDLGTLVWNFDDIFYSASLITKVKKTPDNQIANALIDKYTTVSRNTLISEAINNAIAINSNGTIQIKDAAYTDATTFKSAMSGVLLCYELADPTQGNAIAVKTDNGSGIAGTMATFSTGTPLRGIPDSEVRDVMSWDGSARTVTKNCGKVDLSQLEWIYLSAYTVFGAVISEIKIATTGQERIEGIISSRYPVTTNYISTAQMDNKSMMKDINSSYLYIKDTDYTIVSDFVASLGDAELVYELATPTTEQLTATENASFAGLETYTPQTHAQNNAGAEMTAEAYAGTENGKAVAELKSELKITQSDTLTLTVVGWSSNQQTVTYAHDTAKRNTIDVEPASIKAWTAAGILATAETASTITFECDTVPTADLSFRVTSMEVR